MDYECNLFIHGEKDIQHNECTTYTDTIWLVGEGKQHKEKWIHSSNEVKHLGEYGIIQESGKISHGIRT